MTYIAKRLNRANNAALELVRRSLPLGRPLTDAERVLLIGDLIARGGPKSERLMSILHSVRQRRIASLPQRPGVK
jgi:hypothetical protein